MMESITDAFHLSKNMVIEAGTGVGKSLGYLWPSLDFAIRRGERVVISTYTIQLQEQLLQQEIKRLEAIAPFPFKTVLLKGKNHYINLFKFEQSLREDEAQYDAALTKMQILVWLTQDGNRRYERTQPEFRRTIVLEPAEAGRMASASSQRSVGVEGFLPFCKEGGP
ncbi:DEAD/DEAH box helicase [Rossellomorea sp. H39__3]